MERKLYNGGDRLKERMLYSIKLEGPKDGHGWNAFREIDIPAHSFFTQDDEVTAPAQGVPRIPVYFHLDLAAKHGHRGIVLIDEALGTDVDDDTPYARNEEDAEEKGKRLWHLHLVNTVQRHLDFCADTRALGGAPKAASAFTRHAFKLLGLVDPATTIFEQSVVRAEQPGHAAAPAADEAIKLREQLLEEKRKSQLLQAKLEAQDKAAKEMARAQEKAATPKGFTDPFKED